jgi:hypothetical protein
MRRSPSFIAIEDTDKGAEMAHGGGQTHAHERPPEDKQVAPNCESVHPHTHTFLVLGSLLQCSGEKAPAALLPSLRGELSFGSELFW